MFHKSYLIFRGERGLPSGDFGFSRVRAGNYVSKGLNNLSINSAQEILEDLGDFLFLHKTITIHK